jgi:hypothetical protein
LGLWLVSFALLSQALALPLHQMGRTPSQAAIGELRAIFGDAAVLCVQADDGQGAPTLPDQSHSHCPLCQAGAGALAFVLPVPMATQQLPPVVADFLIPEAQAPPSASRRSLAAQPRGPPSQV